MATSVMRRVSLRNLSAHKVRLFLTVFSIVLGTSFVAGSIIFTSTISKAFTGIFDSVGQGVSVEITPDRQTSAGIPDAVVADLDARRVELGIDRLQTDFSGPVTIADADGRAMSGGGAPSIGSAYIPTDRALDPADSALLPGGRAPQGPDEVVLNASAAEEGGLQVGSETKVVLGQGVVEPRDVTVVGLVDLQASTGGFINVRFDEATARELFSDGTHVGSVSMSAVEGVSDAELRDRVAAAVGEDFFKVRTGEQMRADEMDNVNEFLTIFQSILLAFAAIGLIVGTFIIYNTFSMIVAQRNRELALLRAVGAGQGQVSRSVLFEAFVVGVIGGVVGLGVGVGLAAALKAFTVSASGLPDAPLQVTTGAVLAALFVGVVVTMVSAWVPAVRASKVPPVEAMRASMTEGSAPLRTRTLLGVVAAVIALAAIIGGAMYVGLGPVLWVGGGAAALILAVILAGPALSKPFVGALGRVLGAPFGKIGALARTNAVRNPRRTAATAFALTLGLMLVAIIGTLGTSFKGTVDAAVDGGVKAEYMIMGANNSSLPPSAAAAVEQTPGVGGVVSLDLVRAQVDGTPVYGYSPVGDPITDFVILDMFDGASDQLPADGMFVSERTRESEGWDPGDVVAFTAADGTEVPVTVAGVFADNEALQPWMIGPDAYERIVPQSMRVSTVMLVNPAPGTDLPALRTALEDSTEGYLTVTIQDREEFKGAISSQIDQMLATLYAMLGLALLIAVLGIINTLALSVVERKREIGMLRAIGMSRAQVRRGIYLESVLIAIFGAVLGVVIGVLIGWALVRTLAKWGLGDPVLPWGLIVITLIASAVVGVAAALWPAMRAARTRPLEAIADV